MAEPKIRPLTEDELLYAVPAEENKKAEAKVVPITESTSGVAAVQPLVAPLVPISTTNTSPSFFKQYKTHLIISGLVLIAIGLYIHHQQQKEKEKEWNKNKK